MRKYDLQRELLWRATFVGCEGDCHWCDEERQDGMPRTFVCGACERLCCYCFGCNDDMPAVCDDCWCKYSDAEDGTLPALVDGGIGAA